MLNHVQTDEGDAKVDTVEDDLGNKRVDLHRLEDGRAVVEEVVGASELLEHLKGHTKSNTISHAGSLEHGNELLDRAILDLVFTAQLALDFDNLSVHCPVVFRGTIHSADCLFGPLLFPVSEIESRSFREGQDTDTKADGPNPTETNNNTPATRVVSLVLDSAVVEAGGQPDSHSDEELVGANHGTTNPSRCGLSLVHGHKQTERANSQPGNEPTDHKLIPRSYRRDLDHKTDGYDESPKRDTWLATEFIGDRRCD